MKIHMKLKSQRGAMFGLDARVALAIFAGLSVIAGTAVFSAVRDTSVTAVVTEFDNISKGYINFVFDTGVDVQPDPADTSSPNVSGTGGGFQNLYTDANSTLGWDGPYVTIATNTHPGGYGVYSLHDGSIDVDWTSPATTGAIPGKYIALSDVPCEIAHDVESKVDGTALVSGVATGGGDNGNLRYNEGCTFGDNIEIFYLLSRAR